MSRPNTASTAQPTQSVHIKLTIDGLEVEGAVDLPTGPAPRHVLLPVLHQLTNTVMEIGQHRVAESGEKISCAAGCDACCRQMVPISPTEAHGLARLLRHLPPTHSRLVQKRFAQARKTLERQNLWNRLIHRYDLTLAGQQQLDRDYFAAALPCPFLEKGSCSIYAERPLACREFLVTSPAAHCRLPTSTHVRQVELPAKISQALVAQENSQWLPLILTLDFVAQHTEALLSTSAAEDLQSILQRL